MDPFYDAVENEVLAALLKAKADFVVVGGAAVQHHGYERPRDDIDILIKASAENAIAVRNALDMLASARYPLTLEDLEKLAKPATQFPLRGPYMGVDFIGHIGGVTYEEARADAELVFSEVGMIPVLSKAHLLVAKKASGRPKDLDDVAALDGR